MRRMIRIKLRYRPVNADFLQTLVASLCGFSVNFGGQFMRIFCTLWWPVYVGFLQTLVASLCVVSVNFSGQFMRIFCKLWWPVYVGFL
jgi:hypothetical protein